MNIKENKTFITLINKPGTIWDIFVYSFVTDSSSITCECVFLRRERPQIMELALKKNMS